MRIYHGTAERHLEAILKEGIKPRGKIGIDNWKHTVSSNARAVYLTTTYALYFASNACQGGERMVVLETNTNDLKRYRLAPDEDFLEQATRHYEEGINVQDHMGNELPRWKNNMKERVIWFRKRALSDFSHMWEKSIEYMGTVCYYATIEPKQISRYALVPRNGGIDWASDPTVTPMNFKIMGEYYRQLMRHVFDDKIESKEDIMGNFIEHLKQLSRDDVVVQNLNRIWE